MSYQTARLGKGRHGFLEQGVCVMELASMLAGERFSDHPRSVCRTIAAFLRGYNDMLDDEHRQDLYEYAARAIGTASSWRVERRRADRLVRWSDELRQQRRWRFLAGLQLRRPVEPASAEWAAHYVLNVIRGFGGATHAAVLSLVDELISRTSGLGQLHLYDATVPRVQRGRSAA